jgi:hypothetical protein
MSNGVVIVYLFTFSFLVNLKLPHKHHYLGGPVLQHFFTNGGQKVVITRCEGCT